MPSRKRSVRQPEIVRVFAERLRGLRLARSLTQRDLARQAHVTISYVSKLEAGGAAPGIDLLERLAQALQVGVTELLPSPPTPETVEAYREKVKATFNALLVKAGRETLSMIDLLLARLVESPAFRR